VLGAGHNGLVAQAYLCRAGLAVLAVERLDGPGGPLVSDADPAVPGALHNTHAVFLRGASAMPWFRDLELARHGVEMIQPELNLAQIMSDRRVLTLHVDIEPTVASIARLSARDAATYRRLHREFAPVVRDVVAAEAAAPALDPQQRASLLARGRAGRLALATEPLSPRQFVERHFEHPALRAALLYICIIREFDVHASGLGLLVPSIVASSQKAELCRGGSARLAAGLVADVTEHGGTILTSAEVRRIVIERGRATAIDLADGRRIRARRFIAASLNPQQLVALVGAERLPPHWSRAAEQYRYNVVGPLFGVNVALREPPRYLTEDVDVSRAGLTILGLDAPDEIYALYEGRLPSLASIWGTTPTAHDPTQAPAGVSTAFMWQKVPYALDGDPRHWDARREAHAASILDRWRRFAPNVDGGNVLSRAAVTPLDTERRFANLRGGDLGVGWAGPAQWGAARPFPGSGGYRVPVAGLYLCGAAAHPGGNITGLPGYNAARVIAADIGAPLWWDPPDLVARWSALD
jgi:phytoene dehydrogenase-like protein